MVMRILDTEVTMGVLNRVLIATLLGLLLFAMPCWGGETKEGKRHLKRGQKFEKRGRFKEALEQYSRAIQLDGELKRAWFRRGVLYFRSSHFEEARSDLTRAIELKPDHGLALYVRGVANRYLMELEQAKSDLTEAIEFYRDSPMIYIERAHIYTLQEEYAEAITDLDRAEEILTNAAFAIGVVSESVKEEERKVLSLWPPRREVRYIEHGIQYSPPEPLSRDVIRDDVRSWINWAGRGLRENLLDVYFGRGMAKWFMNDPEEAYADFGRSLGADRTAFGKGILHYLKGEFAMARESLAGMLPRSNREVHDYAEIWIWFASVNLGQFEEANARLRDHFFGERSQRDPDYAHQIVRFLLQEIEFSELVDSARAGEPSTERGRLCEATFYSAQLAILAKDMEESAALLLDRCLATGAWGFYEYRAAAIQKVLLSGRLATTVEAH